MIHYAVSPDLLQPMVPYELDLFDGQAYVSLVLFSLERLRPSVGGKLLSWTMSPFSNHGFLNVRTYVKHAGEPGIFFLAEWLPNQLSEFIGRRTFGLPYRSGRLHFQHDPAQTPGIVQGTVEAGDCFGRLSYRCEMPEEPAFNPAPAGSLDEFLMERYTAFTYRLGVHRLFRVWHEPWLWTPCDPRIETASLLGNTGGWHARAKLAGACYSPGVRDVWLGRPHCIQGPACQQRWGDV